MSCDGLPKLSRRNGYDTLLGYGIKIKGLEDLLFIAWLAALAYLANHFLWPLLLLVQNFKAFQALKFMSSSKTLFSRANEIEE